MSTYNEDQIGKNIKQVRLNKGLTQSKLATISGIENTVISAYENNKKFPSLITLISIAQAMNVSLDELVFGTTADKIVTTSKNDAEVIVRCIYELWQKGMIEKPSDLMIELYSYGNLSNIELSGIWKFNNSFVVDRLLAQLNDHKNMEKTYSHPEKHIEQILESAIFEINQSLKKV